MKKDYYEERDACPECDDGTFSYQRARPCSCHVMPPCNACVDAPLVCDQCGYEEEAEPPKETETFPPGEL